jgi:hypothetical protein
MKILRTIISSESFFFFSNIFEHYPMLALGSLGGGLLGGFIGGMLFRSLGFGGFGSGFGGSGIGIFEILLICGIGYFIFRTIKREKKR